MRAGTLRDRVTIQRPVTADDPEWGPQGGYADAGKAWASVVPQQAGEKTEGGAVQTSTRYIIRLRYRPDLTTRHRLLWRGRVLDIAGVVDVGARRRELEIVGVEHGR